ncbi:MAG: hypothetical protein OXH19_14460 [Chloroflexi bacterium]|nr:hypothetical protein [Chloroflexota bacterium]MCY3588252.1 hypothetical protein [Chloroflexota bacterium]MCY3684929.1 hypothetical protein [Chloroflexota bacterium]MDE2707583.1 hypothetical protein [Chloroflexota bacterium]
MVDRYAIGLLKSELFAAGGRPVIYGTSSIHSESPDTVNGVWPRKLHLSCGIAEAEQYRYVYMSHGSSKDVDWSHEREWRWADHQDQYDCPGLPIWLEDEFQETPPLFSKALVVVPSNEEAKAILNWVKQLFDAGGNDFSIPFDKDLLEATAVISLEDVADKLGSTDYGHLRLEDIPRSQLKHFESPEVTEDFVEKVRVVHSQAKQAGDKEAEQKLEVAPRTKDGKHVADVAGWAELVVVDPQSPLVSALRQLDLVYSVPEEGYFIRGIGGLGWKSEQALSLAEAAVQGAKRVFEENFPNNRFQMYTRWD